MDNDWPTDRRELLARLTEQYRVPPETIEATDAWRAYAGPADSLNVVELILGLETELGGGAEAQ